MLIARLCIARLTAARIGVAVAAPAATLACGTESCWNLEKGHTYTFTVREVRPRLTHPAGSFRCDEALPPALNNTLRLRVVAERQAAGAADCNEAVGELENEEEIVNIADGPLSPGGGVDVSVGTGHVVISASEFIESNGCRGTWGIIAVGRSDDVDDLYAEYRPEDPVVVLYRGFTPDPQFLTENPLLAGKCAYCADHFGVQVTK